MKNLEHNFGFTYFADLWEITYERSIAYYYRLLDERQSGYREYMSTYFNVLGFDVILEHKDYNTPYLYSLFSKSILISQKFTVSINWRFVTNRSQRIPN